MSRFWTLGVIRGHSDVRASFIRPVLRNSVWCDTLALKEGHLDGCFKTIIFMSLKIVYMNITLKIQCVVSQ